MLDPQLWDLTPDGTPRAVFPRSLTAASTGESGVMLIEYAETPDTIDTGPWKKIQIYLNPSLAEHFHRVIDSAVAK